MNLSSSCCGISLVSQIRSTNEVIHNNMVGTEVVINFRNFQKKELSLAQYEIREFTSEKICC